MKNKVELLGWYGGDREIAMSAWTSTSRELSEDKKQRIPKLLKMLADNGHHTPFEKSSIHFLVTTDIATHIHILKHRHLSVNAESARYKELKEDKFFVPDDWGDAKRLSTGSVIGGYTDFQVDIHCKKWSDILDRYNGLGNQLYHECLEDLVKQGVDRKRAKESARYFKTYSSQITADVMFNFRSFAHFQGLRNKPDAQLEIREIAQSMLELVQGIEGNPFEHTLAAFNFNGVKDE